MNGQVESRSVLGSVQNANPLIGTVKKCPDCGEIKQIGLFYKKEGEKQIVSCYCKMCTNKRNLSWRHKNPEKIRMISKRWSEKNKEKVTKKNKLWQKNNAEKVREYSRRWREKNPDKIKYIKHGRKKLSVINKRLGERMSHIIRRALKHQKKGRAWGFLVGYTLDDLKKHLEKQFKEGMSWDNYGYYGWHIDHIVPVSAFNYEKPEDDDFKKCWDLKNLQPLWAKENFRKSAKLKKAFQPSFIFPKGAK